MLRQAPRGVGLEQVVLENEVLRVEPVVRDLAGGVVAHHVGRTLARGGDNAFRRGLGLSDKTVHRSARQVGNGIGVPVRAALILGVDVVVGGDTAASARVGHADTPWDAVSLRVGSEVGVEAAVLLHDDHHVLDLVQASMAASEGRRGCPAEQASTQQAGGEGRGSPWRQTLPNRALPVDDQ